MGAFGKIRHTTIKGEKGTDWYVELWKEGHTDASIDMTLAGEGFTITWNGEGSTRNRNFLGSECVLNLFVQNDTDEDLLYDILSRGFRKYFIRIYKNSTASTDIWWYGWIAPAFDAIENAPYPYQSSITATDSYGYYSQRPIDQFENDGSDSYNVVMDRNHSVADVCTDFIKNMELYTDAAGDGNPIPDSTDFLSISMIWTLANDSIVIDPPPSERYYISKAAFAKNENFPREYKESDVFKDTLKMFNLTGMLAEGRYYFFQPNSYLNNSLSSLRFYNYDDLSYPADHDNFATETHSLTINQTDNVLLGGSSFTYEPPLKSARASFTWEGAVDFISEGTSVNFGNDMTAGQLFSGDDSTLKFDMTHTININLDDANAGWRQSSSGYRNYYTNSMLYGCSFPLKIKASNGSTTKWLSPVYSGQGRGYELEWVNTETTFVLHRGYQDQSSPPASIVNDWNAIWDERACTGLFKNTDNKTGPCKTTPYYIEKGNNPGSVIYQTDFIFSSYTPPLDFDADISINIGDPNVVLKQYGYENIGTSQHRYMNLNANLRFNSQGVINEFLFDREVETSTESKINVYTTEQTINTAIEQEDLGEITIGQTSIDPKFSVRGSNKESIVLPFQVGSDATTSQNITRLLTDQFLEMQITPLQILQGSIQSPNISPLQVIKYKLNSDDADFGYYMFLGGTFKANSEIMDGEWFKLKKD